MLFSNRSVATKQQNISTIELGLHALLKLYFNLGSGGNNGSQWPLQKALTAFKYKLFLFPSCTSGPKYYLTIFEKSTTAAVEQTLHLGPLCSYPNCRPRSHGLLFACSYLCMARDIQPRSRRITASLPISAPNLSGTTAAALWQVACWKISFSTLSLSLVISGGQAVALSGYCRNVWHNFVRIFAEKM